MTTSSENQRSGRLLVDRMADDDIKMRDLYVLVDDEPERTVHFGKSLEYGLAPGEHRIKITNRLFTKAENFTVNPGETVRFSVANVAGGGLFAPLMLIGGTGAYRVRIERA